MPFYPRKYKGLFFFILTVLLLFFYYMQSFLKDDPSNPILFGLFAPFMTPFLSSGRAGSNIILSPEHPFVAFIAALMWAFIIEGIYHLYRRSKLYGMSFFQDSFRLRRVNAFGMQPPRNIWKKRQKKQ